MLLVNKFHMGMKLPRANLTLSSLFSFVGLNSKQMLFNILGDVCSRTY